MSNVNLCLCYEDSMSGQSSAPSAGAGISPLQQMVASCSGAIITSLFGEISRLTSDDDDNYDCDGHMFL